MSLSAAAQSYLDMAEAVDAGIIPPDALPNHAATLPPLTEDLLDALVPHIDAHFYRRPRRSWSLAAVAAAAARRAANLHLRGRAAWHAAAAANQWVRPQRITAAVQEARACFTQTDAAGWLAACQWQEHAEPWLQANYQQSVTALQQAVAGLQQANMLVYVTPCRLSLAVALLLNIQPDAAREQAQMCLESKDPHALIKAWMVLSVCERVSGQTQAALDALAQAQALADPLHAPYWQGRIAQQRGLCYFWQSAYAKAIHHLEEARACLSTCDVPLWVAQSDNALGQVYRDMGYLRQARQAFAQAYEIYRDAGIPGLLGDNLLDTGKLQNYLGQFDHAAATLHEAERQYRLAGRWDNAAYAIMNRGEAALAQGRYQRALQALETAEQQLLAVGNRLKVAVCDLRLARIWQMVGQPLAAHHYLDQAAAYLASQDVSNQVDIDAQRAEVLLQEGRQAEAVACWQNALQTAEQQESLAQKATIQGALGKGLLAQGALAEAFSYLQQARSTFAEIGHAVELVNCDLALGQYYTQAGDTAAAAAAWQRARQQSLGLLPDHLWQAEVGLAKLAAQAGDYAAALAAYRAGVAALVRYRRDFWQSELAGRHFVQVKPALDAAIRLAADCGAAADVWHFIEAGKAQTLERQLADAGSAPLNRAAVSSHNELAEIAGKIRWLQEQIQARYRAQRSLFRASAADGIQPLLLQLRQSIAHYENLRARVERQQADYSEGELPLGQIALSQFRQAATQAYGDGWGAVSYYLSGDTLFAAWTTASACQVWQQEISGLASFALNQCAQADTGERILPRDLQALGELLLPAWLRAHLQPDKPLLICPSDRLHPVPWPALTVGDGPLVNHCLPLIIPSAHSFVLLGQRQQRQPAHIPPKGQVLAVSRFAQGYAPLPLVEDEQAGLVQRLGAANVRVLQNEQATQANLRAWWSSEETNTSSFFHIATHIASGRDNGRLSGIALHDGDLWLDDVWDLAPLPPLVTLSACYGSHSRQYEGDEAVGLTPTCLAAGANQVVGNLWRVLDPAAAALMLAFYEAYARGEMPASALAHAQRAAARAAQPHAHWGGFLCVGC